MNFDDTIRRRFAAFVNGERFVLIANLSPEMASDPDALIAYRDRLVAGFAASLAKDRWGAGTLSGEFPKYRWEVNHD